MGCEMKHSEWYEGSEMAPVPPPDEQRKDVDVEGMQIENLKTGIGKELFDWMEEQQ